MRNLVTLIDEMLAEIPSKEKYLIESLKDIQDSQRYRGPEDMLGWTMVSKELQNLNLKPESENWKYKICSIFSTMTVEEIKEYITKKQNIMRNEEKSIEIIKEWLEKQEICGNKAWWDNKTYYSLRLDQIRDIVNYVNRKSGIKEGGEE